MGAYLSQPNTTKTSSDGGNSSMSYGFSAMQGWRVSMEVRRKMNEWIKDNHVVAPFPRIKTSVVNGRIMCRNTGQVVLLG